MLPNHDEDRSGGKRTERRGAGRTALRVGAGAAVGIVLVGALGPRVKVEQRWTEPALTPDLGAYLAEREAAVPALRPEAAKGVVWAHPDSPDVTPVSLVYLHGFSADRHEVEPLVSDLARELDANIYFSRLAGHGRDGAALGEATVEDWLDDAAEAVAIGRRIGRRFVVIGTSNGGTLALWTAAQPEAADGLAALVLISPNLGLEDPAAELLLWPWGAWTARLVVGAERCFEPVNPEQARHWTTCYPTRALLPMMALVDLARDMDAGSVTVPTFVAYSPTDRIVDAEVSQRVLDGLTSGEPVRLVVSGADDPEQHVIAGEIMSPATNLAVREGALEFLESALAP